VYGNAALGSIEETINGVKNGTIDIGQHDFASLAGFVPDMAVFNAPFIFKDAAHSMRVTNPYSSEVMKELNTELIGKGGMRIFANCYRGARELTANFPVYSPDDLKGKKIRGVPLPIWMTMIKGMGATPTPVAYSELATALATGVVDGQENPLNNIYTGKLYEVQKYIMMTNHMQAIQTCFFNEKKWQSIQEGDRKIIEKISQELGDESLKWTLEADDGYIEKLKAAGNQFIDIQNGLKLDAFTDAVLKQVFTDFPQWKNLINKIKAFP
jgi:tripartite ATP-independent transporter DctP family solute receptor